MKSIFLKKSNKHGFADPFSWNIPMAFDRTHFSEEGHHVFAEKLFEIIDERQLT